MINTFLWILAGLISGYIFYELIDFYSIAFYNIHISKYIKYNIIIFIVFFSFLKGYSDNNLV